MSNSEGHANAMLVAIPFYKNEQLVDPLIDSLLACRDELKALGAELMLFNDSPDYAPLQTTLERAIARIGGALPARLVKNEQNLGFVRTMNVALAESVRTRRDIVLLNSDTLVFPGALKEMARVADLDPMIAFVNPRSNNATLATLPHGFRAGETPQQSFAAAQKVAAYLPDYSYVPTAIGFCMLIRWKILAEFGLFDEVYGRGYNEENDLVMRAGQCGYRAALANKAFVWHEGEQSFATDGAARNELDARNRKLLLARYPEYEPLIRRHLDSPPYIAEALLGTLRGDAEGKLDLAFDFSSFGAYHNGTFRGGEQVLREAAQHWRDKFNLFILCREDTYRFHNYARFNAPRVEPHGPERFAVIFRVGQPYDWNTIERLTSKGACIGMYALDTISVDCAQLYDESIYNIWQFALDNIDLLATTSVLTTEQFDRRFSINPDAVRVRTMHSLDLADYRRTDDIAEEGAEQLSPGYVLVIGNHFAHKFVPQTARAIARTFRDRTVVAFSTTAQTEKLGAPVGDYDPRTKLAEPNVRSLESGKLSDAKLSALFRQAGALVFPSHYEGFGLPVLEVLAANKPIFARRTPVALEIYEALGRNPNIHLYDTTEELLARLATPPVWIETAPQPRAEIHDAAKAAVALRDGIERALATVTYERLVRRVRAVQHANHVRHGPASQVAVMITNLIVAPILSVPFIYRSARIAYRAARAGRRAVYKLIGR